MKAITCRSYGVLRLEEVDEPTPGKAVINLNRS